MPGQILVLQETLCSLLKFKTLLKDGWQAIAVVWYTSYASPQSHALLRTAMLGSNYSA